jgi:radical SAM-linked protein
MLCYEVVYEKTGSARFLSHRDLTNHLQRAMRRAGVEVAHSSGFHPKMLVSYAPALPLGMEARGECFTFMSFYHFDERVLLRRLNGSVRSGIRCLSIRRVGKTEASLSQRITGAVYSLGLDAPEVRAALAGRKAGPGTASLPDIDFVQEEMARFMREHPECRAAFRLDGGAMKLYLELPALSRRGLRPQDVIASVFGLENATPRLTRERLVFRQDGRVPPQPEPD